ncbi:hypothetical protein FG386_002350 [Cryptosporidium ryanae]|uniref:uncharacterized protein n=1 Tax=Cryptosporidium ryanae TaxID=515981 RepID=UPI00351A4B9E|nr:hypothetical protein FG386_002350 [Cryptosporidium ryanae]
MRTVYTVNTSNKFAALSNSDEDEIEIEKKQERNTSSAKENPSSLIYPKNESLANEGANAGLNLDSKPGYKEGSRRGGTIHRGGRGGFKSNHGRTFDRRDASGKGHRASKRNESVEEGEKELEKGEEGYGNIDNSTDVEGNNGDNKQEREYKISYEEYMKILDSKKLETPATEKVTANTTHKDLIKEGLTAYVRDDDDINQRFGKNRDRAYKSNPTNKNDKGIFNYFEFVDKYGGRGSFNGSRRGGNGSGEHQRRGRAQQRNYNANKLHGKREAPDVSDTRAFPTLGQ